MAWEWSHSNEGIGNARTNLENTPKEELETIYAEWEASSKPNDSDEWIEAHDRGERIATRLTSDVLVDVIWEHAEEQRTCDNGGFKAWVCPYGCHTVSFDLT